MLTAFTVAVVLGLGLAFACLPRTTTAQTPKPTVSVLVELTEPSVAEEMLARPELQAAHADAPAAANRAQLRRVEAQQQSLASTLARLGAEEIYRMQRLYNGIAVRIPADDIPALEALPGVKQVLPITLHWPAHDVSVPFTGAPALWAGRNRAGVTGEGITIAVIDTGIDYLHRDFGGPGVGYGDNDPTLIGDVAGFPGAQIIGGYDFAGDEYNADPDAANYFPFPIPDPDPYDCHGHGTHVAGTAAGQGVLAAGSTYTGPYDEALDYRAFRIGPGMAPRATLYALKVFGCSGATELTDLAIEWAADPNGDGDFSDHVDVINLSLGSPLGSQYDTSALAAERAAQLGIIVVGSAGNSGDNFYAVGGPGAADSAISVAAVSIIQDTQQPAMIYFSSRGPRAGDSALKPDLAAPGQSIDSAYAGSGEYGASSSGTSMAAPHVAGGMALLRQLYPTWSVAELKALVMSTARYPVGVSSVVNGGPYGPQRTGAGSMDLAAAAASDLLAYAAEAPNQVGLSFGRLDIHAPITETQRISLTNRGTRTLQVTPRLSPITTQPGTAVTLSTMEPITLTPGASAAVDITLTADPAALRHTIDPSSRPESGDIYRHWIGETSGFVVFAPGVVDGVAPPVVRTPYYAAVRPMAAFTTPTQIEVDGANAGELVISGQGLDGADPPESYQSLVSLFELSHVSGRKAITDTANVTRTLRSAYGDLQQIGVTSELAAGRPISEAMLYFGVATYAPWASPNQLAVSILIDADEDGVEEYRLFSTNVLRQADDRGVSDIFITALEHFPAGWREYAAPLNVIRPMIMETRLFDSRVMVLALPAGMVGLTDEASSFTYWVESEVRETPGVFDSTPHLTYDVARPGITTDAGRRLPVMQPMMTTASMDLALDVHAMGANGTQGILFFSHHNDIATQSQVITPNLGLPPRLYLPLVFGVEER
ncbi:MAG: S8 family serine peptidase [Caldilineaceae bacterium]|nr:S8 family serine peptidase [Caldilineaceae bacterium]